MHFWRALSGHILADGGVQKGSLIIDLGCHRGGMLAMMIERFSPSKVVGIEPMTNARRIAKQRLDRYDAEVQLLDETAWSKILDQSASLVLSHEALQYIPDLHTTFHEVHRVLKPGGFAYMVLGCHTENPVWPTWKRELENLGHEVYDYAPIELMAFAAKVGLLPSVRPLRDSGWVYYDPNDSGSFKYPSIGALLDHHYKHKLLFRFERHS